MALPFSVQPREISSLKSRCANSDRFLSTAIDSEITQRTYISYREGVARRLYVAPEDKVVLAAAGEPVAMPAKIDEVLKGAKMAHPIQIILTRLLAGHLI
jgi:hypothetical protein